MGGQMDWFFGFLLGVAVTMALVVVAVAEEKPYTQIDALQDTVTVLRDSLNNRAEPIYFNELKLIGFDCRLLVNK